MGAVGGILFVLIAALGVALVFAWNRYVTSKDALVYPNTRHVFERGAAYGVTLAVLLAALGGTMAIFIKVVL